MWRGASTGDVSGRLSGESEQPKGCSFEVSHVPVTPVTPPRGIGRGPAREGSCPAASAVRRAKIWSASPRGSGGQVGRSPCRTLRVPTPTRRGGSDPLGSARLALLPALPHRAGSRDFSRAASVRPAEALSTRSDPPAEVLPCGWVSGWSPVCGQVPAHHHLGCVAGFPPAVGHLPGCPRHPQQGLTAEGGSGAPPGPGTPPQGGTSHGSRVPFVSRRQGTPHRGHDLTRTHEQEGAVPPREPAPSRPASRHEHSLQQTHPRGVHHG